MLDISEFKSEAAKRLVICVVVETMISVQYTPEEREFWRTLAYALLDGCYSALGDSEYMRILNHTRAKLDENRDYSARAKIIEQAAKMLAELYLYTPEHDKWFPYYAALMGQAQYWTHRAEREQRHG